MLESIDIRTPMLQRLHRDWESRRGIRELPSRSDFDALDLKYAMGWLSLIDVQHEPLRMRFRLHGTRIVQRVGYDMTGKDIEQIPSPLLRDMVRRHFTAVVERRVPMTEIRERKAGDDRIAACEVLVLPLSRDGGQVDMLIIGMGFP